MSYRFSAAGFRLGFTGKLGFAWVGAWVGAWMYANLANFRVLLKLLGGSVASDKGDVSHKTSAKTHPTMS